MDQTKIKERLKLTKETNDSLEILSKQICRTIVDQNLTHLCEVEIVNTCQLMCNVLFESIQSADDKEKIEFCQNMVNVTEKLESQLSTYQIKESDKTRIASNYIEMVLEMICNNSKKGYLEKYPILIDKTVYIKQYDINNDDFITRKVPNDTFKEKIYG